MDAQDYTKAVSLYEKTLVIKIGFEIPKEKGQLYSSRGWCYLHLGGLTSAERNDEMAIALESQNESATRCLREVQDRLREALQQPGVDGEEEENTCDYYGARHTSERKILRCWDYRAARYCGAQCQWASWVEHKRVCKK